MTRIGIIDALIVSVLGFVFYGILAYLFSSLGLGESAFFWALLGIFIYPTYRRYHRIGWNKITGDIRDIEHKAIETIKGLFYLTIFVIVSGLLIWGGWKVLVKAVDFITPDKWTLMVCSTKMGNGVECQDDSYVISGFNSAKECMLEGASRFAKEGFECGSNCNDEYGLNVCKEVCNKSGCRQ